jgi:hypothetical protein
MNRLVLLVCFVTVGALHSEPMADWTKIIPSATVQLRDPRDISISPEGLLYIADTGHQRVVAVDSSGKLVAETGGLGDTHGQFRWPREVVADRGNAVWVLDYGNRRIERFTRSLEYQGTFTITVPNDATPHQPDAMAISPQGDLYVFDRDDARLLRYDQLFSQQGVLGSGSGAQFVSAISSMAFVPERGVIWWERGSDELHSADALLTPSAPIKLGGAPDDLQLSSTQNCLLYATPSGAFQRCALSSPADTLVASSDLARAGIIHLAGLALSPNHILYLLDSGTAAVFRVNLQRE